MVSVDTINQDIYEEFKSRDFNFLGLISVSLETETYTNPNLFKEVYY